MRIYYAIWKDQFIAKIAEKHHVTTDEVEGVLFSEPHIRRAEKGRVKGEDLYAAYWANEDRALFDCLFHS